MIKAVIIDDEQHCTDRLAEMLQKYYQGTIELAATAASVETGREIIQKHEPDLVFLDVQINALTGFDLLDSYAGLNFSVIFTTAYEQYAIKAFKFNAIDYLLKPIDLDDLKRAIEKFVTDFKQKDFKAKFEMMYSNFKQIGMREHKMAVPTLSGIEFIAVSSIIRCESDINYTTIYKNDKTKLVVAKTLKEFEELLTDFNFFRIHNSHLINLAYIKAYHKGKGGYVELNDGSQIEVSTRKKEAFIAHISKMG